jgi:hypothetical protein
MVAEIVVRDDHGAALLAPGQPLWLKTPWNARVMLGEDGCLSGPSGQAPRQYEIGVSRAVKEALPQEEAPEVYLDARGAEPEVIAWARAGAPAGADESGVVRALIEDLSRRPYSLDTRAIDPMHPLASFLAGAPGHCEYFASALALGLRARGIPARVVGGFLGAETSTFDDTLTVRESRAHLWVEAEGRTPPSSWQASLTGSWQALVRGWDSLVIGLDLSDQADLWVRLRAGLDRLLELARSRTVWFTGAAACLAALLTTAWRRRSAGVRRAVAASRVPHLYRRLLQIAARYDLHVLPAETAREFATRAAGDLGEREALALLSALYEREQFGGIPPSHAEEKAAEAALNRIRMAGRRPL